MVRLREIPRTATFAWSSGTGLPLIATGTRAGAVDADFSNETQLELWDLHLANSDQGPELQPTASISTDSRFYDLAWSEANDDHEKGIIAGALENGSLDLWDADRILKNSSDAFMSRTSKHSGAIKTLQFNPFRPELLATAGAKGELFISNLNDVSNPFRLGSSAARADDYESLDWNKKVPHILVTGSSGGFVTVWDVKAKKESLTLNNLGRKPVSAVAWDPTQSTKLMTAIPDDNNPLILVWDLRNSNAPERTLKAHEQGVLSLSWCRQDPDLLLSCGKDNRTICWNPNTAQPYGDFPIVTNWTFQTRWNPHNPSLLATASFDGKISVQTIQSTRPAAGQAPNTQRQALNDEDFFNNAQTAPQVDSFTLPKAPKWLERPIGASFGFGGKVVSFRQLKDAAGATSRKSKIQISQFAVDSGVGAATETFENSLKSGDLASICESRIERAETEEEKADWKVIQTLISDNPRKKLVEYLGFSDSDEDRAGDVSKDQSSEDAVEELPSKSDQRQVNGTTSAKNNRLSSFFDNNADSDGFLSNLSATKGAKTNNPFQIYSGSESLVDKQLTKAVLLGQFEKALEVCLKENRMSDAFMIAICGGQKCIEKAQSAYFAKQSKGPKYLRVLASVVGKNLWDVVYNADLTDWKEIMAALCTFADQNEFPDLCEALGDRLEDGLKQDDGNSELRKNASFCYLAGSKLEKVVAIWIEETMESERVGLKSEKADSTFSIHARSLQNLIEKVTVFREVTNFQDTERQQTSGWKLATLYDMYTEYADVVASHGQLKVAEKYLDLLPPQYAAADVARNRVKQASKQPAAQSTTRQQQNITTRSAQRTQPQPQVTGFPPSQQPPAVQQAPYSNPYAPAASPAPSNPYAPQGMGNFNPGYQQPMQQQYGHYNQGPSIGAPPRNINPSPSKPPPPRSNNTENWNDTPMVVKPPTSRRGTPATGASAIASPFPNQASASFQPPPGPSSASQHRGTPPLPPPPKGSAPPPRMSSPSTGPPSAYQQPDRPPSAAANAYAPPPPAQSAMNLPPSVPRGPSPYNPPPSGAPPLNRYAPSPAPASTPDLQNRQLPPPPPPPQSMSRPGPTNQYSPQSGQFSSGPQQQGPPSRYAPDAMSSPPPSGPPPAMSQGPPQGPPQGSRQGTGPPQPPKSATPTPSQQKYPPGDRSHIPDNARVIYDVFNAEMQRIKPRAPASFKPQVLDTEKRLNILFDHLNNESLLKPDAVVSMVQLAQALHGGDYETAQSIQMDLHTNKVEQCGQWMVGVKRLIIISKAMPSG
ncbi:MAG: protein transport protein S31 [Piccolia ochrophora]|nr:MAG: protein transport protein S31 [Piccolia ochrophora]